MDFKQPHRNTFNKPRPQPKPSFPMPEAAPLEQKIEPDISNLVSDLPKEDLQIIPMHRRKSKKKKILIILAIILLLALVAAAVYWFVFKPKNSNKSQTTSTVVVKKKEAPPAKIISPLTGIEVASADIAARPITGLMIENSPEARPQSGLTDAGVVYEAIAEGGITRFLAVFQESKPNYIGPIRSARPYYLDFILPYDAGYGHVGGSPEALSDIKTLGVKDLDQFYNGNSYVRISERYAPHNVYTGFDKLDKLNASKGYDTSKATVFNRKPDVPQTPTAKTIDLSISSPLYSPRFEYDASTNTYKRSQGGEAHIDQKTKAQISPKVVIALVTDKSYDPDGYHTDYKTVGGGKMYVFQDGIVSEGTWAKSARKSQYEFTDKNGLPMKLNTGQTWVSLVANQTDVVYKP